MKQLSFLALLSCYSAVSAQSLYEVRRSDVEFRNATNSNYDYPLTGGLNNPQFSSADLDGDGVRDLYIFDRTGGVSLAMRHAGGIGTTNYSYMPELVEGFPNDLDRWVLLRDYNCDGVEDLFTYIANYISGDIGIRVFRGSRNAQQRLTFDLVVPVLKATLPNGSNLQTITVSNIDLPAIDDVDGDGDLDILAFHPMGSYVEWFRNQSQENGFGCDSLQFIVKDDCWGRMYESGVSEILDLSPSPDSCTYKAGWTPLRNSTNGVHAGSSLLSIDMDNDGDKELFLGDLSFSNFTMLTNGGNADTAWMTAQEVFFPAAGVPVDIDIFPAGFHLDVNNDGILDLLVSPNAESNSINQHTVWYYTNTQTNALPFFDFQQNNFLSKEYIDLGANSAPTWVDYNGDGLFDLVVGNYGIYQGVGNYNSSLTLFKNVGTLNQPIFRLDDTDVAGLQSLNIRRLAPVFGDLDNDGDMDIVVGQDDGTLLYIENKGTATAPSYPNIRPNYELIDVGLSSTPTLGDLDADGDLDLVIGERNGNFNYFENIGTPTVADFSNVPTTATFGMIDTHNSAVWEGNSTGSLAKMDGKWHFFVGNTMGEVWHYDSLENNLLGTFPAVQDGVWNLDEGDFSYPAAADINGDGYLDVAVGNRRGGLAIWEYDTTAQVSVSILADDMPHLLVYPNPAQDGFYLKINDLNHATPATLQLFDVLGQQHLQQNIVLLEGESLWIDAADLAVGCYFVQIQFDDKKIVQKLFVGTR